MLFFILLYITAVCGNLNNNLEVPSNVDGVYISNINSIVICWQHIQGATQYQVQATFSDGSTKLYNTSEPGFTLQNVAEESMYVFKVRQWTGLEYSTYSDDFPLITVNIVNTDDFISQNKTEGLSIDVNINETSTFTWGGTPLELVDNNNNNNNNNNTVARLTCLQFTIETCLQEERFREWYTNETLVSDVRILDFLNEETNRTETVYLKNHTIHYDKHNIESLGFVNVSCRTQSSSQLSFQVENLYKDSNYTYIARIFLGGREVGVFDDGDFTATGYVPPKIVIVELLTGLHIYLLACGILLFWLMSSFLLAIICGWERLMSDLAVKKDKVRCQRLEKMEGSMKAKLLSNDFINNETQLHEVSP